MKFALRTFGCQMNYADSEKIVMILAQSGCARVLEPADADLVILNTCSVRQKGEDRVFGYVREVKRAAEKQGRRILVGITGCMARKTGMNRIHYEADPDRVRRNARDITLLDSAESVYNSDDPLFIRTEGIDFIFRIEETAYLTKILTSITGEEIGNDAGYQDYLRLRQAQEDPGSANVIIQTGCDNYCTFCIVPYTRGRETSRPADEIVAEVREAVAKGAKQVVLLGQNVNSYGKETRKKLWNPESLTWASTDVKTPFRELLDSIDAVEGLDRVRFTSSNPHDMTRDILDAHFELPSVADCLHFALQSGSDTMLARMNRKHTYADFRSQVEYLRSRDPLFGITTDIIVGFPGETDEEFAATARAFEECEFDFAYIARYSERSGTLASKRYPDDVPPDAKAARWDVLNGLLKKSVLKRNALMVGRTETILVDKISEGAASGRTRNFKEVFFPIPESVGIARGSLVDVRVLAVDGWVLRGEIVS